jgi:hypothetical protein
MKGDLNLQIEITNRLNEALMLAREEYEEAKRHNMQIKTQLEEANKMLDENVF